LKENNWIIRNGRLILPERGVLQADLGIHQMAVLIIASHIDPQQDIQDYGASKLHSSSDFTPFENREVTSRVEATFLRGNLVCQLKGDQRKERLGTVLLRRVTGA
jgi:dihydroorotase-like cyclic amidohydrolase